MPSDFNSEKVHLDFDASSNRRSSNLETNQGDEIDIEAEKQNEVNKLKEKYIKKLNYERDIRPEKLREHIFKLHPAIYEDDIDDYENWSMLQDINTLRGKLCCSRKYIMRFNRSIGLGPSLFLL